MRSIDLRQGDCLEVLKTLPDNSVDSIVTDPPYGLSKEPDMMEVIKNWMEGNDYTHNSGGFMGKKWDSFVPGPKVWTECLRVLKPGGHILCFAGSRTYDMMCLAIRMAGFEIRDQIMWIYGSGFPKSQNVGKAIDKAAGAEDEAKQWEGWGTALKPAHEPVVVARKPIKSTVANNVLEHGTGALNIDGCRVPTEDKLGGGHSSSGQQMTGGWERPWMKDPDAVAANAERSREAVAKAEELGRWPANVIHDGSEEVMDEFAKFGESKSQGGKHSGRKGTRGEVGGYGSDRQEISRPTDSGTVARFFYCAKTNKKDRGEGNNHPTVKPNELMKYLCRLVTPPGGTVLDPFMGSGSTGKAALEEGFGFVGIEQDEDYFKICQDRVKAEKKPHEDLVQF